MGLRAGGPRHYAWILVLLVGAGGFEAVRQTLVATGNEALVPTLLLLGALVVPCAFVTFVRASRVRFTIGFGMLAAVALAGGVVRVILAGLVEFETLQQLGVAGKGGVAVIEELAKLVVPAALLLVVRTRRVADGLILGVASGAGFAALETMGYAFTTILNDHGDLTVVSNLLLVRGLWSPAGHMAWTGIAAAALYYAAGRRFARSSTWVFVGSLTMAVALHTAWDTYASPWAYAVIAVVGLGTLGAVVHRLSSKADGFSPQIATK
jgi:RsiW-degrading membrane proteinase PrsW (M82 family)